MSDLKVSTDPAEVGLDAGRLQRLDRRLARWVDDGQLPGFLVTVARARAARARRDGRAPATSRTACRWRTTPAGASTR